MTTIDCANCGANPADGDALCTTCQEAQWAKWRSQDAAWSTYQTEHPEDFTHPFDEPAPATDQAPEATVTATHFTAWLVNDPSCLDQDCMDVTVLEDTLIGADPEDDGAWSRDSTKPTAFYAVTTVNAKDGDIEDAQDQAEDLLRDAGWVIVGNWDATDNAYIVTVARA